MTRLTIPSLFRAPGGFPAKETSIPRYTLETIIIVLLLIWLLGGFIIPFGGSLIHLLLAIILLVVVIRLLQGRSPLS